MGKRTVRTVLFSHNPTNMIVQNRNLKQPGPLRWTGLYLVKLRSRVAEMNSHRPKLETPDAPSSRPAARTARRGLK